MKPHRNTEPKQLPKRAAIFRWGLVLCCFVAALVITFTLVKMSTPAPLPEDLVGTWQVTTGELACDTVTFQSDGTFLAEVQVDGRTRIVKAKVSYHGDTLQFHWTHTATGKTGVETQRIQSITSHECILQTQSGMTAKLIRRN